MSTLLDFLPAVEGLKELRLVDRELLVMVAGFEERRLAAAKALTDTKGGKVAILRYKPDHASNDFDALARELGSKGVQLKESNIIEYDRFQPRDFPEAFKRCIKVNRSKHVILDISAMSKLAILLCLDVCR